MKKPFKVLLGIATCCRSHICFFAERNLDKRVAVILLSLFVFTATNVWAKTIRVKFPPGRTTVILEGKTTGGPSESGGMDPIAYRLRARKGQQMSLRLISARKNAVFGVYLPGMDLLDGAQGVKDWSGTLPRSGDYEIIVYPDDEMTNTTFTLEVTIR